MSDEKTPVAPPAGAAAPMSPDDGATPVAPARPTAAAARAATDDLADDGDLSLPVEPNGIPAAQMRAIIEALQVELEDTRKTVAARDAQLEAANEKVLRAVAEVENMRKRVEREKEEIAKYAVTKLARDIVLVADNFERAIQSVPAEARVDNPALTSLVDGVTLTEREFLNTLERHGIKRVAPHLEPFNPHQHQAVMEQANPDVASGTVLQVFQVGYLIEDRVLRPAMVVVSTGGPKGTRAASGGSDGAGNGAASRDNEGDPGRRFATPDDDSAED